MKTALPTAEQLEKLPMRAVVAYAARTAHRVSSAFRGIVADDILDDALHQIDSVATIDLLNKVDASSVIAASERVIGAYISAPDSMKSAEKFHMLFSLVQAALSAMDVLLAVSNPSNAGNRMKRAVQAAQRAVRPLKSASFEAASAMIDAARQDYDILLRRYGEQKEVVIGDPVDCFGKPGNKRCQEPF